MEVCTIFTDRFVKILQIRNITPYKIAKDTNISQGLMGEYKQGKKIPTVQNLIKIADYLDCSIDYLVGRTDYPDVAQPKQAPEAPASGEKPEGETIPEKE